MRIEDKLRCGAKVCMSTSDTALHVKVKGMFAYVNDGAGQHINLQTVIWAKDAKKLYEMLGEVLDKVDKKGWIARLRGSWC